MMKQLISLAIITAVGLGPVAAQQQQSFPPLIQDQQQAPNTQDPTGAPPQNEIPDFRDPQQNQLPQRPQQGTDDDRGSDFGAALGEFLGQVADRAAIPPRVAYIQATLFASDGRFSRAQLRNVDIVNSYAPKSFSQDSGSWTVMLYGRVVEFGQRLEDAQGEAAQRRTRKLLKRYRVRNPLTGIEQELPEGSEQVFAPVQLTGGYDWHLVVPLYDGGTMYDVDYIRIIDNRRRQVILTAELP